MMEQMLLDTLHGHWLITLNGDRGTHQGLALSILITRPSRGTPRCQHTGSSNFSPGRRTKELLNSKLLEAIDHHVLCGFGSVLRPL